MKDLNIQDIEFYIKLLDDFPALIWRSGINAKCDYFNKAWLQFRGRSMDEEFGDGWAEGIHPEDLNNCLEKYLDSFNKRIPFTLEYRLRRHDGIYRNIIDYGRPFFSFNNEFFGYIGACYDITEKIENEAIIKNSNVNLNRLSTAVQQSPNTIVITNLTGEIEFVNKKFTETTGYTYDEAIGQNPKILKTEFLPAEAYSNLWTTISNGNIWTGEFLNKKKSGELFWERAIISPVFDEKKSIINYIAIKEDITEQKLIQKKLNSQEEVNEAIAYISKEFLKPDISIDEISVLTVESCISISKSLSGLISLVNQDTSNLECSFFALNNDNSRSLNDDTKVIIPLSNGVYNSILGHSLNINDSFYSNNLSEFTQYPELPKNHNIIFNCLSIPAIVNKKSIGSIYLANKETGFTENDLKNVQKIANIFALAIYRKLTEQELIIAKQKAEESDKLKSAFLANMSHEIRTPMNAILGFAELLKKAEIKPEKREKYVEYINLNCRSLNALINDIIDISRIETNSISVHCEDFIIGSILTELFEQFQLEISRLAKNSVELRLEIGEGLYNKKISSDLVRFKQVISNLVGNAIKFTSKGNIVIGCSKSDNGFIKFFVEDTGIGIPEEAQSLIFERFRQEDGSITRNYGGSGLGLAISKSLINLLGGKIGVESQKNVGSKFYFTIPDKSIHNESIESIIVDKLPNNQKKEFNWKGKSILFVDDDKDTQDLFAEIIDGSGLHFFVANNGDEAINICKNEKIELILMDIHLPGINGKETAKIIMNTNNNIKIIAQTADVVSTTVHEFKNLGFVDVVSKPFNIEKLLFIIDNYLK
ncbi:MAG: hypothetical protein A2033_07010 [Bacteroidetes bacterium GWA2_31_9]|nr:MAG: hypothetical protein A2033_07010 [Bacteroidetes bacterium GWA2_31_9]